MQDPRLPHLQAAKHTLRYLKTCPSLGLLMSTSSDFQLQDFCDSDWASCPNTRRSISGWYMHLGGSPISWKAKKQSTVALSSAEAEYRSMRRTHAELAWLTRFKRPRMMATDSSMKDPFSSCFTIHVSGSKHIPLHRSGDASFLTLWSFRH